MGPPPIPWKTKPMFNALKEKLGVAPAEERERHNAPLRMYVNGAYYPNWAVYQQGPPSSLNLRCLSHIFYAFAHLKPDGTVFLSDEWADTQIEVDNTQGCLRSFSNLKKEHRHLKVIISIGGGAHSQQFATVAADPHAREVFANSAAQLVREYELDGIDIDWEHPEDPKQGRDYIDLLHTIRRYLPSTQGFVLTSALPAGEWALKNIDVYTASHLLDFINVMSYDFSGPWIQQAGHQAQLFAPRNPHNEAACNCGDKAISYLLSRSVPAAKLLLGIPVYGRSFLGANQVGQAYHGKGGDEEGVILYKDLPGPGAQELVDEHLAAAWCVGGEGGFVTYDNPASVRIKAGYVRQRNLGGIFFWTGAADVRSGERSLVEASYMKLHGWN